MLREQGVGIGESLLLVAAAGLAILATAARVLPAALTPDTVRRAAQQLHTDLQLARVEAVSLDRPCYARLDPRRRSIAVLDSLGTASASDDRLLRETTLPPSVTVLGGEADPGALVDDARVITLEFRPAGSATSGAITVFDGSEYRRVRVDDSAHLWLLRWDGHGWVPLS